MKSENEQALMLLKFSGDELKWHQYLESRKELASFKTAYKRHEDEMIRATMKIWNIYCPMKKKVSTNAYFGNGMRFHSMSSKSDGKTIKLALRNYWNGGGYGETFWEFPSSWLSLADDEIQQEIQKMLDEEGLRYTNRARTKEELETKAEEASQRALYAELKEKFDA